jgi:glycosyltransferase involved in cell wall biosynthesis
VSIVTPSYNQGEFLEETIRSVLLQGYPALDYLIMDGGSTDGSVDIIRRYSEWLSHWVSGPDGGQTQAINTGFKLAKGDVVAWLNADDTYVPGAVWQAAAAMGTRDSPVLVYGDCQQIDEVGRPLVFYKGACDGPESFLLFRACVPQPTTFFRRSLLDEVGYLDESLHYAMDCEFFLRVAARHDLRYIPRVLANYRVHSASKTSRAFLTSSLEHIATVRKYWGLPGTLRRHRYSWAARRREANAHLHCSYESLIHDRRTAVAHIAHAVALYPPILFGREAMSQLIQVVIGPQRAMTAKRRLGGDRGRFGPST